MNRLYTLDFSINKKIEMSMEKNMDIWSEVRCTYNNEEGYWCVDAWKSDNDDEDGSVIAVINDKNGDVYYIDALARFSKMAQEVISEKVKEVRKAYKQKQGELGETMVLLAADMFKEVYEQMENPDYTELACKIRDLAHQFEIELDWQGHDDDRDYIMELENFEKREMVQLKEMYCRK